MRWKAMGLSGGGGGGVDVENLQVLVGQDKFYSMKFCVTCSGSLDFNGGDGTSYEDDNSTLAPAFLVLSVGFISSGVESVIHCQVGLLGGAYILLTYTNRYWWSIGHQRPLAIALCSGLLWSFRTNWSLAVSALLHCLASNCCEAGLSFSSPAGSRSGLGVWCWMLAS